MAQTQSDPARVFGPFRLSLKEQALFVGDRRLPLGGRAFGVLLTLTDRPGELISKAELLAKVWPDVHVDDAALRVHISLLRKVLGPAPRGGAYISNVTGRGYRFVEPLVETSNGNGATASSGTIHANVSHANVPSPALKIVGRDTTVQALRETLSARRFITITGPGGMGKTTVALTVATQLVEKCRDGVHFIDLTSLSDPTLVLQKVASSLQCHGMPTDSEVDLVASLQHRRTLLVLDNCEHLVEPVALLTERILAVAPDVHVLTTSREPLRAAGEWVHRLPPLDLPPPVSPLNATEVLSSPSVILFLDRARAENDAFILRDTELASVVDICHRLEGIPLAIELAAARVDLLGIQVLAQQLSESFGLLTGGRRTALPRQRTLRATLDWSYSLLAEDEKALLRRLATFQADFTFDAAEAVAADLGGSIDLLDCIAALVAKSLISATPRANSPQYRLLETTRAYAREKLTESDERDKAFRLHADYFRGLIGHAEADWAKISNQAWHQAYAHTIRDVRAAIDWLITREGEEWQGVFLTSLSSPLWFALGLVDEYRGLAERALGVMHGCTGDFIAVEMRLNTWLGAATLGTLGPVPQMAVAYTRALTIANELRIAEYQLYALWGLAAYHYTQGEYTANLGVCEQFSEVTERFDDAPGRLVRDRIMASALCLVGRLTEARAYGERALQTPSLSSKNINRNFHELDHHLAARLHLPRILWLQGFPDRAASLVREGVQKALSPFYSPPLCCLLAFAACPIALWSGDAAEAERYLAILTNQTANHQGNYLGVWRECFTATASLGIDDKSARFGEAVTAARHLARGPVYLEMMATIRGELCDVLALERALAGPASWCTPEILRGYAASIAATGGDEAVAYAETLLGRALAMAREQGALSWQLRTATTLARLFQTLHRQSEARAVLASVYESFGEGFGTADLKAAKAVLEKL